MDHRTRVSAARTALPVLVVAALLSGCAGEVGDAPEGGSMPTTPAGQDPAPTSPDPAPGSPDPGASPAPSDAPGPTAPSDPPSATVTVAGTVEAGVEVGCLVLTAGGTTYLLLGHPEELRPGRRVTVGGVLEPDLVTTCQQGTPLRVRSVGPG